MEKKLISVILLLFELSAIFPQAVPLTENQSNSLQMHSDGSLQPFTNSHGFPFTAEDVQTNSAVDESATPEYVESTMEPPAMTTESKNQKPASETKRTKREYDEIPEAPRLEEMTLPRLAYFLDTAQPSADDEHMKSNIKDKVKGIFVTLRPFDESEPNDDKDVVGYLVEEEHRNLDGPHAGYDKNGNKIMYVTEHDKEDRRLEGKGYVWDKLEQLDTTESPKRESLDERIKSNIRDEVKSIFVTLRPFDETEPNDDKDVVGYLVEEERRNPEGSHASYTKDGNEVKYVIDDREDGRPDSIVTQRSEVAVTSRTFGMNLSLDHGYIWNKLIRPGVVYTIDSQDYQVTPTIDIDIDGNKVHVTESPEHNDFDIYVNIEKLPKPNSIPARNEKLTDDRKENDADKTNDDKINSNGKEPLKPTPIHDDSNDNNKTHNDEKNKESTEPKPNFDNTDKNDNEDDAFNKHNKNPAKLVDNKPIEEKKEPQKGGESAKKEESEVDQLNREKISELLGYWTRPYFEYLTQTVGDMVRKEVKRQLQNYKPNADEPKINKTNDVTETEPPTKNDKENPNDKENEQKPPENKSTEEKITKKLDQSSTLDAEPKTNNTKTDDKENPNEKPNKIIKEDSKTTNIFIFFPNSSATEILQSVLGNKNDAGKPADEKKQANTSDNPDKKSDKTGNDITEAPTSNSLTPTTTNNKELLTTTIAPSASDPQAASKDELTTTLAPAASTNKEALPTTTVAPQAQTTETLDATTTENPLTTSSTTTLATISEST